MSAQLAHGVLTDDIRHVMTESDITVIVRRPPQRALIEDERPRNQRQRAQLKTSPAKGPRSMEALLNVYLCILSLPGLPLRGNASHAEA